MTDRINKFIQPGEIVRPHVTRVAFLLFSLITLIGIRPGPAWAGRDRPFTVLKGIPARYTSLDQAVDNCTDSVTATLDGSILYRGTRDSLITKGLTIEAETAGRHELVIRSGTRTIIREIISVDGILSILPPFLAILFALVFKQVVLALLAGIWLGSFFITGFQPLPSLLRIIDHYVIQTIAGSDEGIDHTSIIVFTLLLGGMAGITSRMGGMQGIVDRVARIATTPRRGQFAVWLMGVIIFFDDYTNTLIVGNSMRPLTDRLRISREKLSYIVDSTAAPITSLAVITSWIGFEISLINQSFVSLGVDRNPFTTFVSSLPYSFYPILAILFVLFIVVSGRDYGPMLGAERRARSTGKVSSDTALPLSNIDSESVAVGDGITCRWLNGIVPVAAVILVTFIGLVLTGRNALRSSNVIDTGILDAIKESNSFVALLWGSSAGCIAAGLLALSQKILSLTETVAAWINGIRSMLSAIIILVLAWCIGNICTELHTADYLVHNISAILSPHFLPVTVFLLAMGISFSTGTSWGTMSILTPIVIPLVYGTASLYGMPGGTFEPILLASIAAILSGAVFGDHCSPISDTTIMSSMASAADHIDHVRTQLPYALTVGLVSLVLGYLLTASGVHSAVSLLAGALALAGILRIAGRKITPAGR